MKPKVEGTRERADSLKPQREPKSGVYNPLLYEREEKTTIKNCEGASISHTLQGSNGTCHDFKDSNKSHETRTSWA